MAGIPLITRRTFNFNDVDANSSVEVVMVKQLDVTPYAQADLVVRIHSSNTGGDIANGITVQARQYSQDSGDPGEDFIGTSVGTVDFSGSIAAGTLGVTRLTTPYGQMLRFLVKGLRGATGTTDPLTVELSALLVPRASD